MFGGFLRKFWKTSALVLLIAGFTAPSPANAQGFVNAVPARARIFPEVTSGVVAMKRDAAGRYYVLPTPPNVIWIFNSEGKRIGQIPRASEPVKIQYAADFDLDSDGRVLVADRAANAVEIFSPEGAFLAKVAVFAPTGIVGLPDHQFAVSSLRPKRLVEIRDDDGGLVRSFGDLSEAGADPQSTQLQNLGKVFGDGAGDIYFAFASLPDPTVRKYDRFGYAANDVTYDMRLYGKELPPDPDDRVQFGVSYTQANLYDSFNTWAAVGNKGDIFFGGGASPGLGARHGEGPQTAQSASANILSTGFANAPGGGSAGGGMVSAQGMLQPDTMQFHLATKQRNNSSTTASNDAKSASGSTGGSDLQFTAQTAPSDLSGNDNSDITLQEVLSTAPVAGPGAQAAGLTGAGRSGFGGAFGGSALGQGFSPGLGGGFGQFGNVSLAQRTESYTQPAGSATTGHTGFQHAAGEPRFNGPHGRFGEGVYNFTGTVKINLDSIVDNSKDKPGISAVAVDPVSRDVWASIGKTLAHFDQNGGYIGDYFIATPEGALLHASAIIVEPGRLIVASDSRGVYEFARGDASGSAHPAAASTITGQPSKPEPANPQPTRTQPAEQQPNANR